MMNPMQQMGYCRVLAMAGCIALLVFARADARGAMVTEYFDYGTSSVPLNGLGGAGNGWTSAWTPTAAGDNANAGGYFAGERLVFNNANYNNTPNLGGAGHGVAGFNNIANAGSAQQRSFEAMTGTIWISGLVQFDNPDDGHVLLWLNRSANTQNFVSYRKGDYQVRYGNANTIVPLSLDADTTYLYLVKLVVDPTGNDALSFWIKSEGDDISSESALGAALFFDDSSNIMTALSNVGLSFETNDGEPRNGVIDALRISNDPDGLTMVTLVPEPASLLFLGLGGLIVTMRPGRRARHD